MASVVASALSKRYGAVTALDGVDLRVGEGEVRGLLGPNGAGKTTLLRILLGLIRADAGSVSLCGRPPVDPTVARVAPELDGVAGFVEDPAFYPYLSARRNLEILAELDGGDAHARIDAELDRVELADRAAERVAGYSTGMRQRLGLAAALLRAPSVLLLDEPTAGLDPGGVELVGELVRALADEGVSVLLSSHQIVEVGSICDGFDVLSHGRVAWSGSAAEMQAQAPPSAYRLATSDDERALALADGRPGLHALPAAAGMLLRAEESALDALVIELAREGVAVRRLELARSPLESMFFALTGEPPGAQLSGADVPAPAEPSPSAPR